jgi:predicted dehydrogenase
MRRARRRSVKTHSRREFLRAAAVAGVAASGLSSLVLGCGRPAKIRVGQIGTRHLHAAGKMDAMRASDDFDVVGIVEPDPHLRAAAEASRSYAGLAWLTEEQLLRTDGVRAVAVETEIRDLVPTAARCIAAGKHVHLDKPPGESLPAFRRLLEEATRRGLTVQMGYMLRYNPAFQLCFRLAREGYLGEVFAIDATMSKAVDAAVRRRLLPYRGGSMFEIGCHVIDAVVTVLGRPSKVTAHNRSSSPLNDGFADNCLAVLEYPRASVTVRSAIIDVEGEARRHFTVSGTKGTFAIRPLEPPHARLSLDAPHGDYDAGDHEVTLPPMRGRYHGEFEDLARVIRGQKTLEFSPEHDLNVQETVLLASGLPVR